MNYRVLKLILIYLFGLFILFNIAFLHYYLSTNGQFVSDQTGRPISALQVYKETPYQLFMYGTFYPISVVLFDWSELSNLIHFPLSILPFTIWSIGFPLYFLVKFLLKKVKKINLD